MADGGDAAERRTEAEYRLLLDLVANCSAPCNVLVFGVAWDALLLAEANWAGRTVFLEDDYKWQQMVRKKAPCMDTYLVHYSTRLRDWPLYEEPKNYGLLEMVLPLSVVTTPWDIIVVRGPAGTPQRLGVFESPGRMQSLFMASQVGFVCGVAVWRLNCLWWWCWGLGLY